MTEAFHHIYAEKLGTEWSLYTYGDIAHQIASDKHKGWFSVAIFVKLALGAMLLSLAACAPAEAPLQVASANWDQFAYVADQTAKPHWGVMKALEQPGIY